MNEIRHVARHYSRFIWQLSRERANKLRLGSKTPTLFVKAQLFELPWLMVTTICKVKLHFGYFFGSQTKQKHKIVISCHFMAANNFPSDAIAIYGWMSSKNCSS